MLNTFDIPKGYKVSGSTSGELVKDHKAGDDVLHVDTGMGIHYLNAWKCDVHVNHDDKQVIVV